MSAIPVQPPSLRYPLGTDELGRNLLAVMVVGLPLTLRIGLVAGAVGLGIGVLLGSKITRFILFTAVGTLLSDALGGEIKRIGKDFMEDLQDRLGGEGEEA